MDKIFKHSTPVQIRFNDIDLAGHVNNAVHLSYFDYGRVTYFDNLFRDCFNWREKGLVIVNIAVNYINPVFLEDKIIVKTKISAIGNKSVEMIQQICRESDHNYLFSTNKSVLVGYNYLEKHSFPIPGDWRKMISDFEEM